MCVYCFWFSFVLFGVLSVWFGFDVCLFVLRGSEDRPVCDSVRVYRYLPQFIEVTEK